MSVTIYLKPTCPYCKKAMSLLRSKGVDPTVIDIAANPGKKTEMVARAGGRTTVPQIFINDKHVGGSDDLGNLNKKGLLDKMLGR